MSDGLLQRLPDLTSLLQRSADIEARFKGLTDVLDAFGTDQAESPLAAVAAVVKELGQKLNIDTAGFSTGLPSTITVIQNALPTDVLRYAESLEEAYTTAQEFLKENPLAKAAAEGHSLEETALAVIQDALQLFEGRLADLADGLIDAETLKQVNDVFASIEAFRTDFPTHADELLPFITQHLIGIAPDALQGPLDQLNVSYAVLAALDSEALAGAVVPAMSAVKNAWDGLAGTIETLDPADAAGYQRITESLDEVEAAINSLFTALSSLYGQVRLGIDNHSWDNLFSTYRETLQAVTIEKTFSIDTVIDEITGVLEDMLDRFAMITDAEDLKRQIELLSGSIRDTFLNSSLAQIRQTLLDFLEKVSRTIDAIPVEEIRKAVEDMIEQVNQKLTSLDITRIREMFEKALNDVETCLTKNIQDSLTDVVRKSMSDILGEIRTIPVTDLVSDLTGAIHDLQVLISELENALKEPVDSLTELVSQLDQLSFTPVSDAVVTEIDDLKGRLDAINPQALSDVEKIAIKAGLAVLQAVDLEAQVTKGLKTGFHAVEDEIRSVLEKLTAVLQRLREQLDSYNAEKLMDPVEKLMKQASGMVDRLNGRTLIGPLVGQVDSYIKQLESISPARLLDPIKEPYSLMMGAVDRLDPAQWISPAQSVYDYIDSLLSAINLAPVFDELDRRQREILNTAKNTLLTALNKLNLPEPLDGFFDQLRPVFEGITETLFQDPDTELKMIGLDLKTRLQLSSLFEPLDTVFSKLEDMINSIPPDALTETMNTVRKNISTGLDSLDPRTVISRLHTGQDRLSELTPAVMLAMPLMLPEVKLTFDAKVQTAPLERQDDVAAVSARFDAVFAQVNPDAGSSLFQQINSTYLDLVNLLRQKLDALDPSGAEEAYAALRNSLDSSVPEFLRSPASLSHADIIAGITSLRPSLRACKIDLVLEQFLLKVQLQEETLGAALNDFFRSLREVVMLINPLSLKDATESIYDAVHRKFEVLNPSHIADAIRTGLFDPLKESLRSIDPAEIQASIQQSFERVLGVITNAVKKILTDIAAVIDDQIRAIREEVQMLLKQITDVIKQAFESFNNVLGQVERLVFQEILERLKRLVDNLGISFDKELDRVRNAFDDMLAAIPV